MNQILVSEKLYITPELKRKKRMYKIDFFISVFLVCILFSYYIYAEYDKNKNEAISQEILSNLSFEDNVTDDTTIKFSNNSVVVILNTEDPFEVVYSEPIEEPEEEHEAETIYDNINWLRTNPDWLGRTIINGKISTNTQNVNLTYINAIYIIILSK